MQDDRGDYSSFYRRRVHQLQLSNPNYYFTEAQFDAVEDMLSQTPRRRDNNDDRMDLLVSKMGRIMAPYPPMRPSSYLDYSLTSPPVSSLFRDQPELYDGLSKEQRKYNKRQQKK